MTSLLPGNITRILVVGQFINLDGTPITKGTKFTPQVTGALTDQAAGQRINTVTFTSAPDPATGIFEIPLPAGDDTDVVPNGFNYKVDEPTGASYFMDVSVNTPTEQDSTSPYFGQQVIYLTRDEIPTGTSANPGAVQLLGFIASPVDQPPANPVQNTVWVQLPVGA